MVFFPEVIFSDGFFFSRRWQRNHNDRKESYTIRTIVIGKSHMIRTMMMGNGNSHIIRMVYDGK